MAKAAPCPPEDLQWAIAVARLVLPPEIHVQAPPNLSDDLAPSAGRRHRRLGWGLAGDGRPREPRAGLAGARPAAGGHRGGRARAGAAADRLPRVRPGPDAVAGRVDALPRARCLRRRGPGPRRRVVLGWRGAPARPCWTRCRLRRRLLLGLRPGSSGRVRPGRRGGRGAGRRRPRPGGGRGRDRHAVLGPGSRGAPGGRGGRRPPAVHGRRRRDLRAQPQHQLHERLHVQVPLLRLLEGTAVAQPAGRALPARAGRGDPAGWPRPKPRGRPKSACRAASTRASTATTTCTCSRRCARAPRRSTSTASRRSR